MSLCLACASLAILGFSGPAKGREGIDGSDGSVQVYLIVDSLLGRHMWMIMLWTEECCLSSWGFVYLLEFMIMVCLTMSHVMV
jgi:hypothetical protein